MAIPRPTTRLLALLELLQERDLVSSATLARRLEVDRRSIRRYITMLDELGIPVETVRGPHGGYRLRPGHTVPPLLLTSEEATTLALALQALPTLGFALAPGTLAGLQAKLARILPAGIQAQVRALASSVAITPDLFHAPVDSVLVATLGTAAERGQQLRLRYQAESGATTERVIDPYGVARWSRAWYLVAYCHLRAAIRFFRIDRISQATPLPTRFTPPPDFDSSAYVTQAMIDYPGEWEVAVLLNLPPDQARTTDLARDCLLTPDPANGGTLLQGRFDSLDLLAHRLAALPCTFTVREPEALREAVQRLAAQLARA